MYPAILDNDIELVKFLLSHRCKNAKKECDVKKIKKYEIIFRYFNEISINKFE